MPCHAVSIPARLPNPQTLNPPGRCVRSTGRSMSSPATPPPPPDGPRKTVLRYGPAPTALLAALSAKHSERTSLATVFSTGGPADVRRRIRGSRRGGGRLAGMLRACGAPLSSGPPSSALRCPSLSSASFLSLPVLSPSFSYFFSRSPPFPFSCVFSSFAPLSV